MTDPRIEQVVNVQRNGDTDAIEYVVIDGSSRSTRVINVPAGFVQGDVTPQQVVEARPFSREAQAGIDDVRALIRARRD